MTEITVRRCRRSRRKSNDKGGAADEQRENEVDLCHISTPVALASATDSSGYFAMKITST